ncbi:HIT zinc finger [Colletotrichum higginsianum IMI 349063]|uniref:HIT zinc finger n=2 Tax=Colletotrichum higginsianum TaxID=80884 RepID=A0A1B7XV63_COLHI|nr:HIT zinc finger [Colletotrichum higginsianum IMI 349063]OBR03628.1 HIT zinc finger [Colletotrichum higginsianum IMI 349063]TIC97856.1 putative zinc-finger protein C4F10.19c [Colletotrichum higginsianum]
MSISDETAAAAATSSNSAMPPRSPKRSHADLDEPVESASKRSRAASPSDDEAKTRATTAAMANASLTGEEEETRGGAMDIAAEGQRAAPATETAAESVATAPESQPSTKETHDGGPETTTSTTTTATIGTAPRSKMCGVCNEKEGKYKCTRCVLPFCSVSCNKIHRENHPPDPEPSAAAAAANPSNASDLALEPPPSGVPKPSHDPRNPFSVLDDSDQLRYLFRRYPGLQARLLEIIAATEPPPEMQSTGGSLNDMMKARAMAAANPKKEQWTHDVGIRNGKKALHKARNASGEDGEGVREYIELINHLMSEASAAAEAEEVIRKQAAEKDAELIRRLMTEDRG